MCSVHVYTCTCTCVLPVNVRVYINLRCHSTAYCGKVALVAENTCTHIYSSACIYMYISRVRCTVYILYMYMYMYM